VSGFYERPILNSPYGAPELHHPLDQNGQPLGESLGRGAHRRASSCRSPPPENGASVQQASLALETYTENALPGELEVQISAFVTQYKHLRRDASLGNPTPADACLLHRQQAE
jgi:type III restriction enzyme